MSSDAAIGFWSYAHGDNELDNGLILELARLVQDEYNLLTGEPLRLFVDRDSLAWGDAWRERIDSALIQTTFFIPIITPRYFTRPECRRELLEFASKVDSLGVSEFLLPIVYAKPPEFIQENPDKAISLIASIQYVDWQELRLVDPSSHQFRKAVNSLAKRLQVVSSEVAERQLHDEMSNDHLDVDGDEGISEIVAQIMDLIPDWLDVVMGDKVVTAQIRATWSTCITQIMRLKKARSSSSALLAAEIRAAKEMLPILERDNHASIIYLERSIRLDPLISSLARLLSEHPESYEFAIPIRQAVDEAIENIAINEKDILDAREGDLSITQNFDEWKHHGRIFQKCLALTKKSNQAITEGNEIIRRWDAELSRPGDDIEE